MVIYEPGKEESTTPPVPVAEKDPPKKEDPQNCLLRMVKYLFDEFITPHQMSPQQAASVKVRDFVPFAHHRLQILAGDWPKRDAFITELDIRRDDFDSLFEALQDPYDAVATLLPIWHVVVMSKLPVITHVPSFVHVSVMFGFNANTGNERVVQIQIPTKFTPEARVQDGFLCSLLKEQFEGVVRALATSGLDAMYENHSQPAGPESQVPTKRIDTGQGGSSSI